MIIIRKKTVTEFYKRIQLLTPDMNWQSFGDDYLLNIDKKLLQVINSAVMHHFNRD